MKKVLTLFLVAFVVSFFAARAMADSVILSPNGVAVGMHHDHHRSDEGMHHIKSHDDRDVDHRHAADRGHDKDHTE